MVLTVVVALCAGTAVVLPPAPAACVVLVMPPGAMVVLWRCSVPAGAYTCWGCCCGWDCAWGAAGAAALSRTREQRRTRRKAESVWRWTLAMVGSVVDGGVLGLYLAGFACWECARKGSSVRRLRCKIWERAFD